MNKCPDSKTLASYVSGSLDETLAISISQHLGNCRSCQQRADALSNEADTLIDALRWRSSQPDAVTDQDTVNKLIARAQTGVRPPELPRPPQPGSVVRPPERSASGDSSVDEAIALDVFVTCLHKSRLMHRSEIELLAEQIEPADSDSFAQALIRQGKLTRFQATALKRGKYKGLVLGNYVVLEKLGQGGMGNVFLARHKKMGRQVCLKVLRSTGRKSPAIVERFRREARTVAALKHPNIVVAHDADEEDGIHFLVMEYIQGSDLAKIVETQGPLRGDQAVQLVLQAARALDYAHNSGVVHRDIKPHNLLLDNSGAVKVLDMGLARFDSYLSEADASLHQSMTSSGVVMGTVDYMSPEQALNSQAVDHRSDVYSLGCTLYYLLTGESLFGSGTVMERLIAHREQPIPALDQTRTDVPAGLDAVFRRMVAKDQGQRYQSMSDLAIDLEAVLSGSTPQALRQRVQKQSLQSVRKYGRWVALILFVLLFAGTAFRLAQWELGYLHPPGPPSGQHQPVVGQAGLVVAKGPGPPLRNDKVESPPPEFTRRSEGYDKHEIVPRKIDKPQPHKPINKRSTVTEQIAQYSALIVVPADDYSGSDYFRVKDGLMKRQVRVTVASWRDGYAYMRTKDYRNRNPLKTVDLKQCDPAKFDIVVFTSGQVREFTRGKFGRIAIGFINNVLRRNRFVAFVGNARQIMVSGDVAPFAKVHNNEGVEMRRPKHSQGWVLVENRPDRRKLFDELLKLCCQHCPVKH